MSEQEVKVEEQTQEKLDELFDDEAYLDEPVDEPTDDTKSAQAEDAAESETPTPDDSGEPVEGETDEPEHKAEESDEEESSTPEPSEESAEDEQAEEKADKVEMPDAYFRAAIHQGWKPEEIQEFFEQSPDKAVSTLKRIYDSTNKLSQEFARLGQAKLDKDKSEAEKQADKELEDLKSEYGEDHPLVKRVLEQNKKLSEYEQAQQRASKQPSQQPEGNLEEIVSKFFSSDDLKPYDDFYGVGKEPKDLTQDQAKNRWEVLNKADLIYMGALQQGEDLKASKALDLAHMMVSEPVREDAVRKELISQVKKRSKGVSLKPKSSVATDKKKEAGVDLETKVSSKLQNIFNS